MIIAGDPEMHELARQVYFALWARRADREGEPSWRTTPPLTTANLDLSQDLFEEFIASPVGAFLITAGDLGVGPHPYYGDTTYDLATLERLTTTLRVWYFDWDGQEWSRVEIAFPYQRGRRHIGEQSVSYDNGSKPYLSAGRYILDYSETGYEGHGRHGTHDITPEQRQEFLDLVTRVAGRLQRD